jgi:hypothetical protein
MSMPLVPNGYRVVKQRDFKRQRNGYCLYHGDRCVGFAETEAKINQLIEFDIDRAMMHQAPPESRSQGKMFRGISIE